MKRLLVLLLLMPAFAAAQTITPGVPNTGPRAAQNLFSYADSTGVGNGADTTEDTLKSFTIPAGQLANVGDRIHVTAGGTLIGSTDSKTIRLKLGTSAATCSIISNTAGQGQWGMICDIIKIGSNAQLVSGISANSNVGSGTNSSLGQTDTGTLALVITGQNATNSTANSLVLKNMIVDYIPAGP